MLSYLATLYWHTYVYFQTDLEKNKAGKISELQAALREMEHQVEEAMAMQERESAKKAVEEALAQEREKISILTNEVEEMKVLLPMLNWCFGTVQNWMALSIASLIV